MKILVKILLNSFLGAVLLLLINYIGSRVDFHIALNVGTALTVGFLGIPGIALLVIIKFMFMA